jgi:hypothetical protein
VAAIKADPQPHWMLSIPAIDTFQRVGEQDDLPPDEGGTWRADEQRLEAATWSFSPDDLDASAAAKRSTHWIGYNPHSAVWRNSFQHIGKRRYWYIHYLSCLF